jgi:hypothetical protein
VKGGLRNKDNKLLFESWTMTSAVLTHHNDNGRTGANVNETILNVTPVIDASIGTSASNPTTGTLYLVLAAWDPNLFNGQPQHAFKQLLYDINLVDGQPRAAAAGQSNPVEITGSFPGVGYAQANESDLPVDKSGGL